jgi:cysteine desulfurase
MRRIYLDHAATSPLLPAAREAMLPWLNSGNPSSLHAEGRRAKAAMDEARETLSEALGCLFAEALFTSGGTEGANLALIGSALHNPDPRRRRVLISAAEHHCVLGARPALEALGYQVELIPVDREARVNLDALRETMDDRVLIVSAMHANNELGTINPVSDIAHLAHRHGALYHCDAVQTFGKYVPDSRDKLPKLTHLPVDLLTVSAHKIGGPKAVGAIFVRAGVKLKPLVAGGGQEREVRGGTENVAGIIGFAAAVRAIASRQLDADAENPRDALLSALIEAGFVPSAPPSFWDARAQNEGGLRGVRMVAPTKTGSPKDARAQNEGESSKVPVPTTQPTPVLDSHAHVRLPGVDAETMLIRLDREGISASSGSACSSGSVEPSHVLLACGYSPQESKEGLRFTFGPETNMGDAVQAGARIISVATEVQLARA